MPEVTLGTYGFHLVWTAKLPPSAQAALQAKLARERRPNDPATIAAFDLTPYWGNIPYLRVADLRRLGADIPAHWGEDDVVYPLIHGMSFYLVPQYHRGTAVSFSMKGVNLRTGKQEGEILTDEPCQSYWSGDAPLWIDGYVPSHGEAVRQFVPLHGEQEMVADVARAVGVSDDNPLLDSITARYFLPRDLSRMVRVASGYRGLDTGLESLSYGLEPKMRSLGGAIRTRGGVVKASAPRSFDEPVGMGAGALMRQKHPDNPAFTAGDFREHPALTLSARLLWVEKWNVLANLAGEGQMGVTQIRRLEDQQHAYEARLWQQIGVPKTTEVDGLPTIG